jgi:DNA/RNA endonuclease G (NUC1)
MVLPRLAVLLALVAALAGCDRGRPLPNRSPAPSSSAAAGVAASVHVALGVPVDADPSDDFIITRAQYVVDYNPRRLGPNWSAWRLTRADFGGAARHQGHFITDDTLPAGWYRVTHADYSGSGFDRGHLVRSEDRTRSDADNAATFILTNVSPQRHDLNAGPWLRLEDHCRTLAQHDGRTLYIVAGPLYADGAPTIGHGVVVPAAFWKVVVVLGPGEGAAASLVGVRVVDPHRVGRAGRASRRPSLSARAPRHGTSRRRASAIAGLPSARSHLADSMDLRLALPLQVPRRRRRSATPPHGRRSAAEGRGAPLGRPGPRVA